MDPRIDLTLDRDFSPRTQRGRQSLLSLTKGRTLKVLIRNESSLSVNAALSFPWVIEEKDPYSEKEIIYTGNYELIQKKQKFAMRENNVCCECCGGDFSALPFKMRMGLCDSCDDNLTESLSRRNDPILNSFT